jgi:uncharacterized protein YgiM (DUF1202 family)
MARTIAALAVLFMTTLLSGMATVGLLGSTADTIMQIAENAPVRTTNFKPRYASTLPILNAEDLDVAKSVPVVAVSTSPGQAAPPAPSFTVAVESLRVRSAPNKVAPQVHALKGGTRVTVSGTERGWMLVTADDGRTGWVYGEFLRPAVDPQLRAELE